MDEKLSSLVLNATAVGPEETLSKVSSAIRRGDAHGVVVVDGGKVLGVIDDRTLRDCRLHPERTKAGTLVEKTMMLEEAEITAEKVVNYFLSTNARILPVVRKERLSGVITRPAAMTILAGSGAAKGKKAGEYATALPLVTEGETIESARKKMQEYNTYHLPVVGAGGRLVGMVSSYDLATRVLPGYGGKFAEWSPSTPAPVEKEPVSSIMNPVPLSIPADEPLENACKLMVSRNVTALTVVHAGKPVGILTVRGALHALLATGGENIVIQGLKADEKAMAESLREECKTFFDKLARKAGVELLTLHVKSAAEGKKRRYSIKARVIVQGKLITTSTSDHPEHRKFWNAEEALDEVLDKLDRLVSEHIHSKPATLIRKEATRRRAAR